MADSYDLIIIGTGPAGLTAAIYGRRLGMEVAVFGDTPGGNLVKIEHILNYPGFIGGVPGAQLGAMLFAQTQSEEAFLPMARLDRLLEHDDGFLGIVDTREEYSAPAAIVASGVVPRKLDVPNSDKKGIYYCSLCDGPLFRDKGATLAVLGGGNMAVHEALSLSAFAERVIIIHRGNNLRAEVALMRQVEEKGNIEILLNANVEGFHATEEIDGITVTLNGGERSFIPVNGVFMAIGWGADLGMIQIPVETTPEGFLKTDEKLMTSMPGLFAAGDVRDTDMRQIVTACADGARAANYAFEYIRGKRRK
ncbi:MAG: FAD-dependent oxidoreductase [Syntrophobacteraceae bacterium]|jgi:thioredoxin reductase (NADPH)